MKMIYTETVTTTTVETSDRNPPRSYLSYGMSKYRFVVRVVVAAIVVAVKLSFYSEWH